MLTFTTITLTSLGIFYIGYYLGNQTGSTAHVRAYLSEARKQRNPD